MNKGLDKWDLCFVIYMLLSNNPSSGDINSSNLSCLFFLSLCTVTPPREDYMQVDCVLKPRYKKCSKKELKKDKSVKKNVQEIKAD